MNESQPSEYALIIMKNLNLLIVLYLSLIISHGLSGYIQESSALDLLAKIESVPIAAWKIPMISIGLYCSGLLLCYIKNISIQGLIVKVCFELGISFCISYILGFSYTGFILLIIADTMRYFPKAKWKFVFMVFICLFYLLIDCNVFAIYYKITSLEIYLEYFQKNVRVILLGIKNVLNSLNMMVFLVYMILMIREQLGEKERILSLNEKLNTINEELKQSNIQLKKYAKESEKAAETRERNRLAMEIHDTLGHALTGIITGIEACTVLMDAAPEATKVQLKAIAEVARQGTTDVRRSIKALRPDALEKMDLEKALTQMIDEMKISTNVEIEYLCDTKLNGFSEDEENIIYRIVQESITNAIRHGMANWIQVCIHKEYNVLTVRIEDNGKGCNDVQKGFGLHHMEERLSMLQGTLHYNGEHGFIVEAKIPIRWGMEEEADD